ncbi:hypothetical protein ACWF9B_01005 [Streptomyces sp. NPDC055089]
MSKDRTADTLQHEVFGGDSSHEPHTWTWTEDDGNGHMGWVCPCGGFRV